MEIIQAITRCINAKWNENTEGVFVFGITECKSCLFFHYFCFYLNISIARYFILLIHFSHLLNNLLSSLHFNLVSIDLIPWWILCVDITIYSSSISWIFIGIPKMKEVTHPLRIRRPTRIVLDRLCSSTNPSRKAPRIHDPRYDFCSYETINQD